MSLRDGGALEFPNRLRIESGRENLGGHVIGNFAAGVTRRLDCSRQNLTVSKLLHGAEVFYDFRILLGRLTAACVLLLETGEVGEYLAGALDAEDAPEELDQRVREENLSVVPAALVERFEKRRQNIIQVRPHQRLKNWHELLLDRNAVRVNQEEDGVWRSWLAPQGPGHLKRFSEEKPLLILRLLVNSGVCVGVERIFADVAPEEAHQWSVHGVLQAQDHWDLSHREKTTF